MKKSYWLIIVIILSFWIYGVVNAQYYYFDTGTSYPYQQWCAETLLVRVNTQSHPYWPVAGLLRLRLDPTYFSYSTSSLASDLQTQLFVWSSQTFASRTSPTGTPFWVDEEYNLIQMDRNNWSIGYRGTSGLYGTLFFVPRYSQNPYNGSFGIVYDGDTIKSTLSYGGTNIIQSSQQNSRLTWIYLIVQAPCVDDSNYPSIQLSNPTNNITKQSSTNGIHFSLLDDNGVNGVSNVPYVFTWGWVWTGNPSGSISNQYGIDLSTLQISLAGNGQSRTFVWTSFSTGNSSLSLYAQPDQKTWQYLDKNYIVSIASSSLFDYGIERPITMTLSVRDRKGLQTSQSITFNQPVGPTLIAGSRSPDAGASFIPFDTDVVLWVQDDWAGVNTANLRVTLQATNASGQTWWPYIYSGSDLHFSGVVGQANYPDQYISISNHPLFPASSTVTVRIDAWDMQWNADTIADYTFTTRPSCSELQCCDDKLLQTNNTIHTLFISDLFISWGNNPYFSYTPGDYTGYVNCGLDNDGLQVYRWIEDDLTGSVLLVYETSSTLRFIGNNIKAILSWSTMYLSKIFEYGSLSENKWWAGWWSSHLTLDYCPDWDYSDSYYDMQCWTAPEATHSSAKSCTVTNKYSYSDELVESFQYAYSVGMTSMCPIERANLNGNLLRMHLAKMLVEYWVRIIWIYPNLEKKWCDSFDDMSWESEEMQFYVKTVCQMELMWLESDWVTPKKSFGPNQEVDRGQFGTILSRMIFGYLNNVQSSEDQSKYYLHHLEFLKKNNIIKNDDPTLRETRWFVMLMMKRAYDNWLIDYTHFVTSSKNGVQVLISL